MSRQQVTDIVIAVCGVWLMAAAGLPTAQHPRIALSLGGIFSAGALFNLILRSR